MKIDKNILTELKQFPGDKIWNELGISITCADSLFVLFDVINITFVDQILKNMGVYSPVFPQLSDSNNLVKSIFNIKKQNILNEQDVQILLSPIALSFWDLFTGMHTSIEYLVKRVINDSVFF